MEIMNTYESIWEDHHHRSMFLPNTSLVNHDYASLFPADIVNVPQSPILLQDIDSEGNLCNITQMNLIDISAKLDTIEHVMLGRTARQMNLKHTSHFLKKFMIFLPIPMKRCWGLTHPLWSMRLKPIPRLNLSSKN